MSETGNAGFQTNPMPMRAPHKDKRGKRSGSPSSGAWVSPEPRSGQPLYRRTSVTVAALLVVVIALALLLMAI